MKAISTTLVVLLIALAYADTVKIQEPASSFTNRLNAIATTVYVPD